MHRGRLHLEGERAALKQHVAIHPERAQLAASVKGGLCTGEHGISRPHFPTLQGKPCLDDPGATDHAPGRDGGAPSAGGARSESLAQAAAIAAGADLEHALLHGGGAAIGVLPVSRQVAAPVFSTFTVACTAGLSEITPLT